MSLSGAQEAQIEQILGELQGGILTPDQAQARIGAIVDNAGLSPSVSAAADSGPFPSLNLSGQQRAQIEGIFHSAQATGSSGNEVRDQVDAVLTPAQRQQLKLLSSYSSRGTVTVPSPSYVLFSAA